MIPPTTRVVADISEADTTKAKQIVCNPRNHRQVRKMYLMWENRPKIITSETTFVMMCSAAPFVFSGVVICGLKIESQQIFIVYAYEYEQ